MLKESSVSMMMILVATASLIGIGSIYQPADVDTQPREQQPPSIGPLSLEDTTFVPGQTQTVARVNISNIAPGGEPSVYVRALGPIAKGVQTMGYEMPLYYAGRGTTQHNLWGGQVVIPLSYPDGTYNVIVILRHTTGGERTEYQSAKPSPILLQREMQSTAQPVTPSSILGQLPLPAGTSSVVLRLASETRDFIQTPGQDSGAVRVTVKCNPQEVPFAGGYVTRALSGYLASTPLSGVTVWENFPIEDGWQVSASHKYPREYRMSITAYAICGGTSIK